MNPNIKYVPILKRMIECQFLLRHYHHFGHSGQTNDDSVEIDTGMMIGLLLILKDWSSSLVLIWVKYIIITGYWQPCSSECENKGLPWSIYLLPSNFLLHYDDVIMSAMTSQITSLTIVYSTVYSGPDEKNMKSPHHWPLCGEFAGDRWIPRAKGHAENVSIWWRRVFLR